MPLKTVLLLAVALLSGVSSLPMHAQDPAGGKERIRSMIGTWVGAIDTYRGKRSLTLSIDSSGEVTGALAGANAEVRLMGGAASGPRVFGRLPEADLGIEEARPASYDVQLGLAMYGSRLVGFATTAARPGSPGPALTFLAELTRQ